ncbi:hypothetical protein NEOLEDRAFT_1130461 [Neolentinus lepideus HHB14362 ss-1]|uniref:Cora-domain-containing protein n=1 Tax=Neolentinus lepideus HHB14362 ss-1 TaxID=1314782 RepID=A0A165U1E1_9AGAM|nr:hypothetical protein NEOLEDRAFT_1130461 [Neolentinus lepideus HHB14362 ss-1]
MPRENSFTDSDGRSLTPDLDEEFDLPATGSPAASPVDTQRPPLSVVVPGGASESDANIVAGRRQVGATTMASEPAPMSTQAPVRPGIRMHSTPGDRFRASVRKVIQMHRTSSVISGRGMGAGAEPGIDPRRQSAYLHYGHIRQDCVIEMIDYSSTNVMAGKYTNKEFIDILNDDKAFRREPWAKVRWINVGGISWDVISSLALKFNLHPLALEDVLHQRGHARSKADYYMQHLFLRILSHSLAADEEPASPSYTDFPRSASPVAMEPSDHQLRDSERSTESSDDLTIYGSSSAMNSKFSTRRSKRNTMKRAPSYHMSALKADLESPPPVARKASMLRRKRERDARTIEELKKGGRVNVKIEPVCIFLFRDGTVISITKSPNTEFMAPIVSRLRQRDTTLRLTADASLLVQSLLDLIVDRCLEVIDEYQGKLVKLEHDVLLKPNMKTVRHLHIVSGDLILHKRTLEPIKTVVYGLRRYDVDRCAALIDPAHYDPSKLVKGFMSHKAKIYLADVFDHMEYILTSVDMFANVAENLINYTFNMTSYEMNEVMRRLTLATIIFLPLTLLTGYFGMNFTSMWSLTHSDLFFWEIAIPLMVVVTILFMWRDLKRVSHYMEKRLLARKIDKGYKED